MLSSPRGQNKHHLLISDLKTNMVSLGGEICGNLLWKDFPQQAGLDDDFMCMLAQPSPGTRKKKAKRDLTSVINSVEPEQLAPVRRRQVIDTMNKAIDKCLAPGSLILARDTDLRRQLLTEAKEWQVSTELSEEVFKLAQFIKTLQSSSVSGEDTTGALIMRRNDRKIRAILIGAFATMDTSDVFVTSSVWNIRSVVLAVMYQLKKRF